MRGARGCPLAFLLCAWLAVACGGDGPTAPPATPQPAPTPPVSTNPCTAALAATTSAFAPLAAGKAVGPDLHGRWRALDALWLHEAAGRRGWVRALAPAARAQDAGEIAVLHDEGDLVAPPNPFDLAGRGLRFAPTGSGGYDVSAIDGAFRRMLGDRLSLGDDDGTETGLAFGFAFYGRSHTSLFVNSDGNLTFDVVDNASTERNVARLLSGPPRLAPFLADLDPSAGGGVFVSSAPDGLTVTWCAVPGFDKPETTTVQIALLPDASVEIKYGTSIGLGDAVVGLSPGRTASFSTLDLSAAASSGAAGAALGERFARFNQLDIVALSRKYYATHGDLYDQLVVWTDASYVQSPVNVAGNLDASSAPRVGVTFNGTRRDVLIQDVVAVMGPRVPSAAESPRVHRQAFLYVVGAGRSADAAAIEKIDRIRREWEAFFLAATDGRMRLDTRLNP